MAAPKKITPEVEQEILRRRAAGEGIVSIAADFGLAHQTISKLSKRHAQNPVSEVEQEAEAAPAPVLDQRPQRRAQPKKHVVHHPLLPTVFANWDERLAYYAHHSLESQTDWLNYHDARSGRETPAERRARLAGKKLALR